MIQILCNKKLGMFDVCVIAIFKGRFVILSEGLETTSWMGRRGDIFNVNFASSVHWEVARIILRLNEKCAQRCRHENIMLHISL